MDRINPLNFREPDMKEEYPRFGSLDGPSLSPHNRMTSINININNLDHKKEEPKINVKYSPKTRLSSREEMIEQ